MLGRAVATGGLAIFWCGLAVLESPRTYASDVKDKVLSVSVTSTACDPNTMTAASGRAIFSVHNASAQAVEWEILDGVMVVDERENIPPGETKVLKVNLLPGDYQITCGLLSNPKGALHVVAPDHATGKTTPAELIGPLAEYRVFASNEIDGLVDETQRLADLLAVGDLTAARSQIATAHAHYARLAPIALFFPDLDGVVDRNVGPDDALDLTTTGFRQLEWMLTADSRVDIRPVATKLLADVFAMRERFQTLALTPAPTFAGAVQAIGGAAAAVLAHAPDDTRAEDISDLRNYLLGVRTLVDLFEPLIARLNKPLSASLTDDLNAADVFLATRQANGQPHAMSADLSAKDLTQLKALTKRLAETLSRIPLVLRTS